MSSYHLVEYWENRYKNDTECFEWYQRYQDFKAALKEFFPEQAKVLIVGNGSSEVPFELYDDPELQVKDITSIDCSTTVTKRMQSLAGDRKSLEFIQMDVTELTFNEQTFDVIFDKATLDSVLCGEGANERAVKMLQSIIKVLKNQGVYICISYGKPEMRMSYLENAELAWDVQKIDLPRPKLIEGQAEGEVHYCYICRKRGEAVVDPKAAKKK